MSTMRTIGLLLFLLFVTIESMSQVPTILQGDKLLLLPGKSIKTSEVKMLIADYKLSLVGEDIYQSAENTNAIELIFLNDKVYEVHLYNENPTLGSYKNKLPKGIKFGMSKEQCLNATIDKPSYQDNIFIEYDYSYYSIFYWFENGVLSEYSIVFTQ